MKDERGRILRSSNRTRENQDRKRERERYFELANPKRSQRCTEILKIGKLLLSRTLLSELKTMDLVFILFYFILFSCRFDC